MSKLNIACIGVGHHGRHHARILSQMPGVNLCAVVDADEATARAVAQQCHSTPLHDYRELLGQVDAVTIAVPTVAHFPVAKAFLERGVATLVEKPLALDSEEARAMVRLAHRHHAVLQVGHIERYNPAWLAVEGRIESPTYLSAQRASRYPFRSLDVSVIHDVMIHDLELALAVIESPIDTVEATGETLLSRSTDRAQAWVQFTNGARAFFAASRVHHEPVRKLQLWTEDGSIEVDFLARKTASCLTRRETNEMIAGHTPPVAGASFDDYFDLEVTEHDRAIEPLRLEIEDFLRCVADRIEPRVSGEHGYAAVALAAMIEERIQERSPVALRKIA